MDFILVTVDNVEDAKKFVVVGHFELRLINRASDRVDEVYMNVAIWDTVKGYTSPNIFENYVFI